MAQTKGKKMLSAEVEEGLIPVLNTTAEDWSNELGEKVSRSEVVRCFLRAGLRDPDAALHLLAEIRLEDARAKAKEAGLRIQHLERRPALVRRRRDSNP